MVMAVHWRYLLLLKVCLVIYTLRKIFTTKEETEARRVEKERNRKEKENHEEKAKIIFAIVNSCFLGYSDLSDNLAFYCKCETNSRIVYSSVCLCRKCVTLENFINVLSDGKIGIYMWNSLKVTGNLPDFDYLLSSTAGYALSKFRSTWKKTNLCIFYVRNYGSSTDYIDSTVYFL